MVLKKVLKSTKFNGNKLPQVRINTGEKSFPVFLTTFTVVNQETKAHIPYDDYKNLSREEQEKYKVYPKFQVYNVFNIAAQSNLKETRPEMYEKLMAEVSRQARQRKRKRNSRWRTEFRLRLGERSSSRLERAEGAKPLSNKNELSDERHFYFLMPSKYIAS